MLALLISLTATAEEDEATLQDNGTLREGWLINNSRSAVGQSFYDAFASAWQLTSEAPSAVMISIVEGTMTRQGIPLEVWCGPQMLSRFHVGRQQNNSIRDLGQRAGTYAAQQGQRCLISPATLSDREPLQ